VKPGKNQLVPIKTGVTSYEFSSESVSLLAQAFIMPRLSVLFMPVLYLCFGAVFDALVFVALYSWAASNTPANATI